MQIHKSLLGYRISIILVFVGSIASSCQNDDNVSSEKNDPLNSGGIFGSSDAVGSEQKAGTGGSVVTGQPTVTAGTQIPNETAGIDQPVTAGGAASTGQSTGTAGSAGTDQPTGTAGSAGADTPTGTSGTEETTEPEDGLEVLPPPVCEGSAESSDTCQVCIHQGLLRGSLEGTTCQYLGVPYAKPPVGELRWAPPEPAEGWSSVREATEFGPACLQIQDLSGSPIKSEDCLYLNVWAPTTTTAEPLPVMVFLHGGGYMGGATNTYSGLNLAENGEVVVVNMNYRIGPLGFFAHPQLDSQRPDKPSGSDGIRDQQLAMRWVWDNIASFNGDPNNVTLFGESAGSAGVSIHMVSPGSKGLAKRFIMESGVSTNGVENGIASISRDQMYETTRQMASDLCPGAPDVIDCLRELPAEQLMLWNPPTTSGSGVGNIAWLPVIEGPGGVLPDYPDKLLESGNVNEGELIIGTNKNEYALFQLLFGGMGSVEQLRSEVESRYPAYADEIMAIYAPSPTSDANQAYITLMTDTMFRCASRRFARLVSAQGHRVYLYSFEEGIAMHSDEMTYVFGYGYFSLGILPPVQSLVDAIQSYWTNFATTGDPNGPGLVAWPEYDAVNDQHIILINPVSTGSGLRKDACDLWDDYLAKGTS